MRNWFKAAREKIADIIHPRSRANSWWFRLPNSRVDYHEKVGDGFGSNVIMAPILWIDRAFREARLGILTEDTKTEDLDFKHELVKLLVKPNPAYSGMALWTASLISWFTDGNIYWLKGRNKAGQVKQLWYAPHWMIEPYWDGPDFISYYRYTPGGGEQKLKPEDVVHLRYGLDPRNVRKGFSPMGAILREIFNDDEAAQLVAGLLANGGVPGLILSPKENTAVSTEDLRANKQYINDNFTGDKRGSAFVLGAPTDVTQFGFDPQKMALDAVRNVSEERVCAVLGIPAAVVGFGTGIQQTKVGATLQELHRMAWVDCIIPNQDMLAGELTRALFTDFNLKENQRLAWDRRKIRALEDDLNKQAERLEHGVRGGWVMVSEARQAQGLEVKPEHEVFLRPFGALEVGPGAPQMPQEALSAPKSAGDMANKDSKRLTRAQARIAAASERLRQRGEKRLKARLADFFKRFGAAARAGYLESGAKADDDELHIEAMFAHMRLSNFRSELRGIMGSYFVAIHQENVDMLAGMGIGVDLPDSVQLEMLARGGTRAGLVDLTEAARDRALEAIRAGREAGEGVDAVSRRLEEVVPAGPWASPAIRADIMSRTETRAAQTESSLRCYESAEGITGVAIIDARLGPSDFECEALNGQVVSFAEAEGLLADEHPNGTRDIVPIFE